ncbi:MAG: CaiB/BaiF CoA transferase family protein [Dehalococcoidia bacterium]
MSRPLEGITIIDFTRYQQGPYATVMLSDLGADVIKVEERTNGDLGRSLGLQPDGWCTYFEAHNRNKRSLTLDVRTEAGRDVIYRLVEKADVVADNFRPGVMKRLGLDWESLSRINPRIITASASGFGSEGPKADRPSFDVIGQAVGGLMVLEGGGPGEVPHSVGAGLADQVGAMVFALGISTAIIARELNGIGQHVDVSLLGSQIALQGLPILGFLRTGEQNLSRQRQNPLFTYFPCANDEYLVLGILDPKWWPDLCKVLDREDLAADERFATPFDRFWNAEALLSELDSAFRTRPRVEWMKLLDDADIPHGPVNDYASMASEPQVIANRYVTTLEHPTFGEIRVVGTPIRMSRSETGPRSTAPELGQHTEEILLAAGYDWTEIEKLKDDEVL